MPMRYIYRALVGKPLRTIVISVLVTCYVTALALRVVINVSYKWLVEPEWTVQDDVRGLRERGLHDLSAAVLERALLRHQVLREQLRSSAKRPCARAALAQEAQLKMLRYQLNPHFLFNTLNAISTLILDNQNRTANHAVTRLSEFLRYTLDQDPMKKVTLRQEMEALDLYMNTERLRFGGRLKLEYAVEEPALDALVPSLLLQPLIENAVKYAISPREDGGSIRIEGRAARRDARNHGDRRWPGTARRQCADRRARRRTAQHARASERALRRAAPVRGAQQSSRHAHRDRPAAREGGAGARERRAARLRVVRPGSRTGSRVA